MTIRSKSSKPLPDNVSRRDFFGRFSAAAGCAVTGAVTAPFVLAGEGATFSEEKPPVRIGILGLGHRGLELVDACLKIPAFNPVACHDPERSTISRCNARFQRAGRPLPRSEANESELIQAEDIDALIIATPSDLHASQIQAAIDSGKHILTEKPVALSHHQLLTLLPKIESLDRQVFMVDISRRFHPARTNLIQFLRANHLGKLVDVQASWTHPQGPPRGRDDWMLNPSRSGDWLTEHGDHLWDLLMDLHPDLPEVTSARHLANHGQTSLFWAVGLQWQDGASAQVRHSLLPGSNFASPGLSVLAQYEKGLVDLISGRVSATIAMPASTIFPKEFDTTTFMMSTFLDRIKSSDNHVLTLQANHQECRRARSVDDLRVKIQSHFS